MIAVAALLVSGAPAQDIKRVGPGNFPISNSVEVPAGSRLVYVSGQVPEAIYPQEPSGTAKRFGDTTMQTRSVLNRSRPAAA